MLVLDEFNNDAWFLESEMLKTLTIVLSESNGAITAVGMDMSGSQVACIEFSSDESSVIKDVRDSFAGALGCRAMQLRLLLPQGEILQHSADGRALTYFFAKAHDSPT